MTTEIQRQEGQARIVMEDLNGDGKLDAVASRWQRNLGRELLIYHQLEDGRFAATPVPVEIKTEIIAVGFADLRTDPGMELVLFANNGVFSLSTAQEGYSGNLKPLFEWKLIADVPDPDDIQYFSNIRDLTGDGLVDFLIPGENTYGFFKGTGNETFELVTEFSTINQELDPALRPRGDDGLSVGLEINSEDGIKLEVGSSRPTPYADFIEQWEGIEDEAANLLRAENWMPSASLADFNGDGRDDIAFINTGEDIRGQLNLLFQSADGSYNPQPDWQGSIDTRGTLDVEDLDGDGFMDIVKLTGDGNEWDAFFYRNKDGQFDFEQPDQVMRFAGYDVDLNFTDLDNDGRPELNVSYYTIPVVEAIRNTSIVRTQLMFDSEGTEPGQLFTRRPQSRLEESFSASNVRGLAEQMSLRYDVDGDGLIDALYLNEDGTLAAKRIGADLRIESEPFWQYVPSRTVMGFSVMNLNDDDQPDLYLRHDDSVTLLVTAP